MYAGLVLINQPNWLLIIPICPHPADALCFDKIETQED